jgi:oligoendopeptidase F
MTANTIKVVRGELPTRSQVQEPMTWDLSPVYSNESAWEADFAKAAAAVKNLPAFKGKLKRSGKQILAFFQSRDAVAQIV